MISDGSFASALSTLGDFSSEPAIAVAVSGGADSMALSILLSRFFCGSNIRIFALTVDHDLRNGSAEEAIAVGHSLSRYGNIIHHVLKWQGPKPATRIQEHARIARYDLLSTFCSGQGVRHLFLGHHADDQAETVLFRLAKGSGIEGLAGMRANEKFSSELTLIRPLLNATHRDLEAVCRESGMEWCEDPSNSDKRFSRARLRASKNLLETEGLTIQRLNRLAKRADRANDALDHAANTAWTACRTSTSKDEVAFDLKMFTALPEEIALRLLRMAVGQVTGPRTRPPRLMALEAVCAAIFGDASFRAATLSGCVLRRSKTRGIVSISAE